MEQWLLLYNSIKSIDSFLSDTSSRTTWEKQLQREEKESKTEQTRVSSTSKRKIKIGLLQLRNSAYLLRDKRAETDNNSVQPEIGCQAEK
ncbi:hypothetical protein NPIL_608451 [Nephila pilipes]|uniref:Uncharacterized protein n=1 Tax=Nephila pilipes TaxID=299642 RepID=A0A8X6KQU5_NEPPI|nr:hypothetical protein NPIL_608451 [Nephila pilipes]